MKRLLLAAALLLASAAALADDSQGAAVAQARETAIECKNPQSFQPLLDLSASGSISSSDATEALTEANEDMFLKCPYDLLLALTVAPREIQDGYLAYFGTRHPGGELGVELKKWKNHPKVGPLVRSRFSGFLPK